MSFSVWTNRSSIVWMSLVNRAHGVILFWSSEGSAEPRGAKPIRHVGSTSQHHVRSGPKSPEHARLARVANWGTETTDRLMLRKLCVALVLVSSVMAAGAQTAQTPPPAQAPKDCPPGASANAPGINSN